MIARIFLRTGLHQGFSSGSTYNFEQIAPEQSGLTFSNTLVHDLTTKSNVFDHDYFYNGSGVGVEDINNDGLMDVFFTGKPGAEQNLSQQGEPGL